MMRMRASPPVGTGRASSTRMYRPSRLAFARPESRASWPLTSWNLSGAPVMRSITDSSVATLPNRIGLK